MGIRLRERDCASFGDRQALRLGLTWLGATERRALWAGEDATRELPNLPLEDALQLVHLYGDRGSPKFERAAMRWLERYMSENSPSLERFATVVASLASRRP